MKIETAAKIIDQVYDCVLEPSAWPEFLKTIAAKGENAGSSIVVYDRHAHERTQLFEHGADQSHLRVYFEKLASMKAMPGAGPHLHTLGGITTMSMICGEQETLEHDFYLRWIKPSGFRDMIGVMVLKSGKRLAWFSVARTEIQTPYQDTDIQFMDWLSPHICRAFTLADMFDAQSVRIQQLEQVVDQLSMSVILTGSRGVTYMNKAAEELIGQGDTLKIKKNHLTAGTAQSADRLSYAINASLMGLAPPRVGSHMVALPGKEGGGLIASVLPLNWREAGNPLASLPGSAAVLVQDGSQFPEVAGEALAELYGLTPAELRVSMEVARGLNLKQIAEHLGLSENTIKTHLQHVFSKTGVTRQADLARLILQTSPPVRLQSGAPGS
ncbi:MAG: helix-turn-helix transcriptional regulator [Rhodomicrobiaceae bacterium]